MKISTIILGILFGLFLINGTILVLNDLKADNSCVTTTVSYCEPQIASLAEPTGDIVLMQPVQSPNLMLDDSKYWVDYLKTTVDAEFDSAESSDTIIEEMENNPTYWVDYLKTADDAE